MANTLACCPVVVSKVTCANTHAPWPRPGMARIVSYDMRSTTDQLFGLGAGCEGAMDVLLTRVSAHERWQPLRSMAAAARRGEPYRVAFVTASHDTALPLGALVSDAGTPANGSAVDASILALRQAADASAGNTLIRVAQPDVELFVAALGPPPHLLLLGGGPDARPVAELASFLGWRVAVVDHRAAYLDAGAFPGEHPPGGISAQRTLPRPWHSMITRPRLS